MAVGDAYVFPGFLTPVLTLLFFQSHRLLFSHASAEVRGENTPERKVASTWDRTHNHQVMSPTRSPLSHPGGSQVSWSVKHREIKFWATDDRKKHICLRIYLEFQQYFHAEYQNTNLKESADENFKFDAYGKMFSKREENTVGKG